MQEIRMVQEASISKKCEEGKIMEWVKCSERMPEQENNPDVLVYCGDTKEQFVAFHVGWGEFQFFDMDGVIGTCTPSHWMPLPQAPED